MTDPAPENAAAPAVRGRRLLVIRNPAAGSRGGRFAATLDRLTGLGCRIEVRETGARGDAERFAREPGDRDLVVAAGGDGTINEVANGLVAGASGLPLAILPLGTANVLAGEIGLGLDPGAIARTIARGAPRRISLGRVTGAQAGGGGAARLFFQMAGVGFDAHAVAGVNPGLKRRLGKGAYAVETLRQLAVFPFPRYRVMVDGEAYEAASAIVAKGRSYAGRFLLAPAARLEDPQFQVCLFERGGALAAAHYGLALALGRLARTPGFRIVPGRRVEIDGPAGDPVQADGDIVAHLPVAIEIVPDALGLVMPMERSID